MKIGDECWVATEDDGTIITSHDGDIAMIDPGHCLLASKFHRVRIVPADPWQPIETAPKDGTLILAFCNSINKVKIVMWSGFQKKWYAGPVYPVTPTHWQPLPAPPEVE